ncbi:MAG: phosphate acetyltransferase [Buchnera aphidicola (Periphyllus lyropictus)]|uniref:phosphate acetyltransferase n=1 Tax=Buchnera aphidicola TaxID=9 RepID=UPI001EB12594|nr:phosphate acetyltransferase [Buchnera aphidicola]NIH16671.1 phosphate acetyltransferase [Buchnera aphidicola (Periphyllus lyropictus)]USS94578.1 phosphate acetyltransferase [Buchnera aphidicola (Periphyllus lyropictus)]
MSRTIMLIPIGKNKSLNSVSLGLLNILKKKNINLNFFHPFIKKNSIYKSEDYFSYLKKKFNLINIIPSVCIKNFNYFLNSKIYSDFLEKIFNRYYKNNFNEFSLIEGISYNKDISMDFFNQLNLDIARILDAEIFFIITPDNNFIKDLNYKIHIIKKYFMIFNRFKNSGLIINFLNNINFDSFNLFNKFFLSNSSHNSLKKNNNFSFNLIEYQKIPILGICSFKKNISLKRSIFLKKLKIEVIYLADIKDICFKLILFCSNNFLDIISDLKKETLLIINLSNKLILKNINKFIKNNNILFSILILGNNFIDFLQSDLYFNLKKLGVSIFFLKEKYKNLFYFLNKISMINNKKNKKKLIKKVNFSFLSDKIYSFFLNKNKKNNDLCSYQFLYQIKNKLIKKKKTIILPEGENEKIIQAAYLCFKLNLCNCVLLGDIKKIKRKSLVLGFSLPKEIIVINPDYLRKKYINYFREVYNYLSLIECKDILKKNNIALSMLLLIHNNKYDGVVAGIINTTADVIRPALKLIKMKKETNLISSIFFMLFPDKVLIYGDCAINPNPNAFDLSEIAIQSSESARNFGIDPRIAMLSYSTNDSGSGLMVEKIKKATELVHKKCPDLIIEGPIQYDAATDIEVSLTKCVNSKLFGNANVFIFPDLNSGNITYKAVQRNSSIISIGPIVQGLKKPVNDLSRGASIQDILYTISLTAIQSDMIK